jgi:hypothetical protein
MQPFGDGVDLAGSGGMIRLHVADHHHCRGRAGLHHTGQPLAPAVQQPVAAWIDTRL